MTGRESSKSKCLVRSCPEANLAIDCGAHYTKEEVSGSASSPTLSIISLECTYDVKRLSVARGSGSNNAAKRKWRRAKSPTCYLFDLEREKKDKNFCPEVIGLFLSLSLSFLHPQSAYRSSQLSCNLFWFIQSTWTWQEWDAARQISWRIGGSLHVMMMLQSVAKVTFSRFLDEALRSEQVVSVYWLLSFFLASVQSSHDGEPYKLETRCSKSQQKYLIRTKCHGVIARRTWPPVAKSGIFLMSSVANSLQTCCWQHWGKCCHDLTFYLSAK